MKWIAIIVLTIILSIAIFYVIKVVNPAVPIVANKEVIEAINPSDQFALANNTRRSSDINVILNTVKQYMADNNGKIPSVITTSEKEISKSQADLCNIFVPTYITTLPTDPKVNDGTSIKDCNQSYSTGYTIFKDSATNKITVRAPNAEQGKKIEATR